MNLLRPVLAATDFSPDANRAAHRAAIIAHEQAAPLVLMHALPGEALGQLRQWLGAANAPEKSLQDDVLDRLRLLAGEVQLARPVTVSPCTAAGPVHDEVLRQADLIDSQLLVVGARGTGFLRRLVLGTTAERLMRRTLRPLLVVRQTPLGPYRRVLVATDFSPWSQRSLVLARQIAPQAHLTLLTVFQVPFEEKLHFAGVDPATVDAYRETARAEAAQKLNAMADAAGLLPSQWRPCTVEGDASLRIVEKEQEFDCDLVVLGKHGRSATLDLLLGSVTRHVLAEGSSDVLISTAHEA